MLLNVLPVAGRFGKMTHKERRTYRKGDFRGNGPYSEWLRRCPTMLKIGETLFVHAGLDRWALDTDPAEVNAQVRAWISHHQGKGPKPPKATRWTVDEDDGPMWTRAFKARRGRAKDGPSKKTVRAILERLGAARVVLGHSPTRDGSIVVDHPHHWNSVVLVDTRISHDGRGKLSALVLKDGVLSTIYAVDGADGDALSTREASELGLPPNVFGRMLEAAARLFGKRRSR
jgi:hypothetical protein